MIGTIVFAVMSILRILLPGLILFGLGEWVRRRAAETPSRRGAG